MSAAPPGCGSRVPPFPARAYLGGCMSPCGPLGVAWRGCGSRRGAGALLVGAGARREGLGRRWSPPPRPAQQQPGARRLLPGCMPASAWRSRPGSQQLVRPQPSGSGGAARARETTAQEPPAPSPGPCPPPPSAALRGSFASREEGAGRAPRAWAGGERRRGRRWGLGFGLPRPSGAAPSRISTRWVAGSEKSGLF